MIPVLLALYLTCLVAYIFAALRTTGLTTPDALFVFFNSVMVVGTLQVVDNGSTDQKYAYLVTGLTALYVLTSTFLKIGHPRVSKDSHKAVIAEPLDSTLWLMYTFCVLLTMIYYVAIGHITLIDSLTQGSAYDAATARLDSYAGEQYYYPGYVNQFKNALLPALTVVILHSMWAQRKQYRVLATCAMVPIAFVAAAGTGQRAPVIIVLLACVVALRRAGLLDAKRLVQLGVAAFVLFSLMTFALQRNATDLAGARTTSDRVGVFANALWERAVIQSPESGLAAFHYTEFLPTANGSEWLTDIMGILPGSRGSDLSNRVFEMLYGTPRGTAPPSLWGGMYYNFGLLGSIFATATLAYLYCAITRRWFMRPDSRTTGFLGVVASAGMAVSAGAWVAGSPLTILNQGFFAYLALYVYARSRDANAPEARDFSLEESKDEVLSTFRSPR